MNTPHVTSAVITVLLAAGFALVACDPSGPPPGAPVTPGAPSAAPAAPSAGSPEGGECGDDVAIQKKCQPGLVCGPGKGPVSEHAPGICKKP